MNLKVAVTTAIAILSQAQILSATETTRLDAISIVEKNDKQLLEIKKTQPRNIAEILQKNSNIDVAGGSPNAKRIYSRGISEALMNISIDGAKQSKDLHQHRGGLSNIDADILKSADLNFGVSQADQGAGNLGGSIKFETVDAQDLLENGKNYGAYIKTTFGSIDDSYKNSMALYGKLHDKIGILVYGNKLDSENYKTGRGREVLSSAEEVKNYLVKLSIIDLNSHSLRVSHEKNTQEGLYKFGSIGSDFGYLINENEAVPQKVDRKTSVLNYQFNPSDLIDMRAKIYENDQSLQRLDNSTKYSNKTIGADLRNSFTFENDNLKNNLTVGTDYEENKGKEKNGFRSVNDKNIGIFIQNRMNFNKLNLSFGARYDDYEQTIGKKKFSGDDISPNVNVEYFLTDNFSLFAGWGKSISSSNLVPISWLTGSGKLTFNGSENGNLKTQKSEKYEIGTNFDFDGLFESSDNLNFKFTYFDTTIKNSIVREGGGPGSRPVKLYNAKDIESKGFEAKVGYEIENFRTTLGYTHTNVKQNGTNVTGSIRRSAASYGDKITADFTYNVSKNLGFGYSIIGQLKNDNPSRNNVNNKAGYVVHNINANFIPQDFKNLTLSLAVNNLFDKDYSSQTSLAHNGEAVGEAGRDVRVSLKYKF